MGGIHFTAIATAMGGNEPGDGRELDLMKKINENIQTTGWHMMVMKEEDDEKKPPVVYTIGLWSAFRHPDLVMIGMPHLHMMQIVGKISQIVKDSSDSERRIWKHGEIARDFLSDNFPITFCSISSPPPFMQTGLRYYELIGVKNWESFPILQVLWPDENGAFPHEENCTYEVKYSQPFFGSEEVKNPWPFSESPWKRCIISGDIVRKKRTILYITRASNGIYHFMEDAAYDPGSYSANLVEVLRYDPSIQAASTLETGERIMRRDESQEWKRVPLLAQSCDEEGGDSSPDEISE